MARTWPSLADQDDMNRTRPVGSHDQCGLDVSRTGWTANQVQGAGHALIVLRRPTDAPHVLISAFDLVHFEHEDVTVGKQAQTDGVLAA